MTTHSTVEPADRSAHARRHSPDPGSTEERGAGCPSPTVQRYRVEGLTEALDRWRRRLAAVDAGVPADLTALLTSAAESGELQVTLATPEEATSTLGNSSMLHA